LLRLGLSQTAYFDTSDSNTIRQVLFSQQENRNRSAHRN
jgi:hypothetical protein